MMTKYTFENLYKNLNEIQLIFTNEGFIHVYLFKPQTVKDWNKINLIVEFPEDCHRLPTVPFSRERCFDPSNSVVMDSI